MLDSAVLGYAAQFGGDAASKTFTGIGTSGMLISTLQIGMIVWFGNHDESSSGGSSSSSGTTVSQQTAIAYFSVSAVFILICVFMFLCISRMKAFRERHIRSRMSSNTLSSDSTLELEIKSPFVLSSTALENSSEYDAGVRDLEKPHSMMLREENSLTQPILDNSDRDTLLSSSSHRPSIIVNEIQNRKDRRRSITFHPQPALQNKTQKIGVWESLRNVFLASRTTWLACVNTVLSFSCTLFVMPACLSAIPPISSFGSDTLFTVTLLVRSHYSLFR